MKEKRKKYVIDRGFQLGTSLRAAILPLATLLIVSAVLLSFARSNNVMIREIVDSQHSMIEMFLETPALHNSENKAIQKGEQTFRATVGKLITIKENSTFVIYCIIILIVIQTAVIFILSLFFTHKIAGPVHVMTQYLREVQKGARPDFRPLRKKDELHDFYLELGDTIEYLSSKKK